VFAFDASELGIIEGETDHINLTDEMPLFSNDTGAHRQGGDTSEEMEERKAVGCIRTFTSEWAAPVTMPSKKDENNGNWTLKMP
jgi:hypothetical protein